ncbi:MAG: PDZ domain-containing protein [Aureispira sp.]|nr:PDZ domain-containing protein [Aureispira sp.]
MWILNVVISLFVIFILYALVQYGVAKLLGVSLNKLLQVDKGQQVHIGKRLGLLLSSILWPILFAIVFMGLEIYYNSEKKILTANVSDGIACSEAAERLGLQNGDIILNIGEAPFKYFEPNRIKNALLFENVQTIRVKRDGQEVLVQVPTDFPVDLLGGREPLIQARIPFIIEAVQPNSPAAQAGLRTGDQLLGIDGKNLAFFDEFKAKLQESPSQELLLTVRRAKNQEQIAITTNAKGQIGAAVQRPTFKTENPKLGKSMLTGIPKSWVYFRAVVSSWLPQDRSASESLGGFTKIVPLVKSSFFDSTQIRQNNIVVGYLLGLFNLVLGLWSLIRAKSN